MSNDYERSNLWRYRDYVIRSFNEDKPYDQFVVQQLAGDELADESVRKRTSDETAVFDAQLKFLEQTSAIDSVDWNLQQLTDVRMLRQRTKKRQP